MSTYGEVSIRDPQVVVGERGGELLLLHVPSDRYVTLDERARPIWEAITGGTHSVERLVADHAARTGVAQTVAAYQVISFLDELRAQGYVSFSLEGERDDAPHLDVPLTAEERRASIHGGKPVNVPGSTAYRLLSLDRPDPHTRLLDVRQMTERLSGRSLTGISKAIIAASDKRDLSSADIEALLAGREAAEVRQLAIIDDPTPDTSFDELSAGVSTARAGTVVVIIVGDTIIVIVVLNGGGGGSAGKSRSACKTMCV